MNDIIIIALAGFASGITTVQFGFGGGFVVVPLVYQLIRQQPAAAEQSMHIAVATSTAVMIFSAGLASVQHWRAGRIPIRACFPLIWFIAIGAIIGAWLNGRLSESLIHILFILYLLVTLGDCLLRKHFFRRGTPRALSDRSISIGGILTGILAAMLGVGGSVMTVPLLRRHGYTMQACVSAANPLTLPVALCGTVLYAFRGWHHIQSADYLGFISLPVAALLIFTNTVGILFTKKMIPPLPDIWHARIYVLLLLSVLLAMLL